MSPTRSDSGNDSGNDSGRNADREPGRELGHELGRELGRDPHPGDVDLETEILLTRAVDGLLSEAEAKRLEQLLAARPELAAELADHRAIKATTDAMTARILADAELAEPPPARVALRLATASVIAGATMLAAVASYLALTDASVPLALRIAIAAIIVGLLTTLAILLLRRLKTHRRDPYRQIDR